MRFRQSDDGPADWIGDLYDKHAGALYRYAVMITADAGAAGDAVQQVFLEIASKPRGHMRSEEAYLRRAVRNQCYSALRRRRREEPTGDGPLIELAGGVEDRPEERLAIEAAIRTLPAEQREVLHLRAFEGLTFQEMSNELGESINTVASRYRYALEKLRQQIRPDREQKRVTRSG